MGSRSLGIKTCVEVMYGDQDEEEEPEKKSLKSKERQKIQNKTL